MMRIGNKISQVNRKRGVDTSSVVDCGYEATASRIREESYPKRDRKEQREYVRMSGKKVMYGDTRTTNDGECTD